MIGGGGAGGIRLLDAQLGVNPFCCVVVKQ